MKYVKQRLSRILSPALAAALACITFLLTGVLEACATSATWNGTTSTVWSLPGNWSTSPVPGTGDTATFNSAGNGNTTLDLGTGVTNRIILFYTARLARYTIGAGDVG